MGYGGAGRDHGGVERSSLILFAQPLQQIMIHAYQEPKFWIQLHHSRESPSPILLLSSLPHKPVNLN